MAASRRDLHGGKVGLVVRLSFGSRGKRDLVEAKVEANETCMAAR
jgi:hypothetical protein